jgi:hypothetical protein
MAADFEIKAHDLLPVFRASLLADGSAINLTGAVGVKFIMATNDFATVVVNTTAVIENAGSGIVRYDWTAGDTDTPGDYLAEWEVTWPGPQKQTFPVDAYHTITIFRDLDNA